MNYEISNERMDKLIEIERRCDELQFKNRELERTLQIYRDLFTPQKPTGEYTNCRCPRCGRRVRSGLGSSSRTRDKRCQDCGQVIDWTEIDKDMEE